MAYTRLPIDIQEIEKHYRIEEDGAVFSLTKQRYLRAVPNKANYLHVCLHLYLPYKFFLVHRLVGAKYNGECPIDKEACHDDGNKWNNHHTNIVYRTHSENILQSYQEHGRKHPVWLSMPRSPLSFETKQKMADAKKKQVLYSFNGADITFTSIEDASQSLNTYRKKIYRCIHDQVDFKDKHNPSIGGTLSFVDTPIQ
jgi:hypothetical protein